LTVAKMMQDLRRQKAQAVAAAHAMSASARHAANPSFAADSLDLESDGSPTSVAGEDSSVFDVTLTDDTVGPPLEGEETLTDVLAWSDDAGGGGASRNATATAQRTKRGRAAADEAADAALAPSPQRQPVDLSAAVRPATSASAAVKFEPAADLLLRLAPQRVASVAALIFIAIALLAGVCLATAYLAVQPVYRATVSLAPAATTTVADPLTDHLSDVVLADAIERLASRGVRLYDSAADMRAKLNGAAMRIESHAEKLTLSLDSPQRESGVFVLEAISQAYLRAHAASGVRITAAAAADLSPYRDGRLARAAEWFFALLTLIVVPLVGWTMWRLRKMAR
jgi:hypothetical protein